MQPNSFRFEISWAFEHSLACTSYDILDKRVSSEWAYIVFAFYYNSAMIVIKEYRYAVSTELFKNW